MDACNTCHKNIDTINLLKTQIKIYDDLIKELDNNIPDSENNKSHTLVGTFDVIDECRDVPYRETNTTYKCYRIYNKCSKVFGTISASTAVYNTSKVLFSIGTCLL